MRRKLLAIVSSVALMTIGIMTPQANATEEHTWSYGAKSGSVTVKLNSLGLQQGQGSGLGGLPKVDFGSPPGSFANAETYAGLSNGVDPAYGEGMAVFTKGDEAGGASTTIVNFELPSKQFFVYDYGMCGGWCVELYPYDYDNGGSSYRGCDEPTSFTVSGRTLSVKITCAQNEGFGATWVQGSYITQPGLYDLGVVYKTNTIKRTANNMFKIRLPEVAYVGEL